MYVQNGDRPRWAWSGQHVQVSMGWEITGVADRTAGVGQAAPAAAEPAPAPAPAPAAAPSVEGRPAWSWGGPAT
jgi:hypothetical protein